MCYIVISSYTGHETQYAGSQIELFGGEAIFADNSDEVVLNIDVDGEITEEGWHIMPCVDPPSVRYSRP